MNDGWTDGWMDKSDKQESKREEEGQWILNSNWTELD